MTTATDWRLRHPERRRPSPLFGAQDDDNQAEVIVINGTWFTMGSHDAAENERPVHRVWVDTFEIAPYQVTNAEYARFAPPPLRNDPPFNHPQQPVVSVSWNDAVRYCEWLSDLTGRLFRLPLEAEWE